MIFFHISYFTNSLIAKMEYDKSTVAGPSEAESYAHQSTSKGKHLRVQGPKVDTSVLGETIMFPFSGRIAKNRFLKAPMTERLCTYDPANTRSSQRKWKLFTSKPVHKRIYD